MKIDVLEFKNESKDTIIIVVDICSDSYDLSPLFSISDIKIKKYRKKEFIYLKDIITDDYSYRALPYKGDERPKYRLEYYLKYVTEDQLKQALLNAWERYKPEVDNLYLSV